jgi:hypothetical protein
MVADSQALRARRSRRHRAGDHSICKTENCNLGADTHDPLPDLPPASLGDVELGKSGRDMWRQVRPLVAGALQVALLLEACRIVDRLDTLDHQLHGGSWLRFRHDESGAEVTVYVDRVLAEAREQQTTFRGIVVELQKYVSQQKPAEATTGGGVLADLTARIAERRANTSG